MNWFRKNFKDWIKNVCVRKFFLASLTLTHVYLYSMLIKSFELSKVVMSPHTDQHRFVESYYRMLSDSDLNEFQKVLEMKVSFGIYCKNLKGRLRKKNKILKFCNFRNALISVIYFFVKIVINHLNGFFFLSTS